jgi:hypothetical protein
VTSATREQCRTERLLDRCAAAFSPFTTRRFGNLVEAFEAEPFDRAEANLRLREACTAVIVDHDAGCLALEWSHEGGSIPAYTLPLVWRLGIAENRRQPGCAAQRLAGAFAGPLQGLGWWPLMSPPTAKLGR